MPSININDYPKNDNNYMVTGLNQETGNAEIYSKQTEDEAITLYFKLKDRNYSFVRIAKELKVITKHELVNIS